MAASPVVVVVFFTTEIRTDGPDPVQTIISFFSLSPNPFIARLYDDRPDTYVNCRIEQLSSRAFTL